MPGGFTEDPPADPPEVVGAEAAGAGVAADLEAIFFFFNFFWMFYYDLSSRTVLRWMKDCKRIGIPIKKSVRKKIGICDHRQTLEVAVEKSKRLETLFTMETLQPAVERYLGKLFFTNDKD